MDAEILKGFIEEAKSNLPEMGESILAYARDTAQLEKLRTSQKQANTIKGAALMIGLPEIGELCGEFEQTLESIIALQPRLSESQTSNLLGKISQIEEVINFVGESVGEVPPAEHYFSDQLFEDLTSETNASGDDLLEGFEDFEIDGEMMEVFALEAEDHLQNIAAHLSVLEKAPNNREALLEIRRSSHTLKGSAGIVGLKKISTLAHRVEDLLDYISENEIEGNKKVLELLLASMDCLESLTRGENSPELEQNMGEIYHRFDALLASLEQDEGEQISAVSKLQAAAELTASQVNIGPMAAAESDESAETAENTIHQTSPNSRSVIRVSLDRLDGLVKLVSEMVISRSVFEQRILELEQQLKELNHTTTRLRRSTSKLEVDFEARTLSNSFQGRRFNPSAPETAAFLSSPKGEFDTLELDRYTDFHQTTRELIEATGDTSAIHNDLDNIMSDFGLLFDTQRHLIDEMQESLLRLRMVPFKSLAPRLHRTVRVTMNEEGKEADLFFENENIEVDTEIIDTFVEPLIHLLRNAVAHGIEPVETRQLLGKPARGKIRIKAYSEGTHIVFVISDDGRGISVQALKEKAVALRFISAEEARKMTDEESFSLVFLPGLSTAEKVNQISGRGLGMNVVKASINRRQGDIFVSSESQKGTSFTVRFPMSLAVTRVILIKAEEQIFAFPLKLIKQVVEVSPMEMEAISRDKFFRHNDKNYKLVHFNEIIHFPVSSNRLHSKIPLLLLETLDKPCALMIDELLRPEEVVIKPLGSLMRNVPDLIGATILGDGSVVPVLDLVHLLKKKISKGKKAKTGEGKQSEYVNVLIVDDSPSVRQVNSTLVKNAGWKPVVAKDGIEALEIIQAFRELPDIILTDVEMPRMDGYELLASLKRHENLSSIPVIMITSRAGQKHRQKAYDLGVSDYLTKPYEESALIERMKKLLEKQ
jgi:chemosensory pili system protein ChpA (sensor histidine kinase/response regulator)